MKLGFFALVSLFGLGGFAHANSILEPTLTVAKGGEAAPHVALTLDACSGLADRRILDVLLEQKIPATIFVTARWLKRNAPAIADFKAHPELFEIENHGARHIPTIDVPMSIYGLKAAGSPQAVIDEVKGGEQAVIATMGRTPKWFRGAGAVYTKSSMAEIEAQHQRIAGYSIAGDGGASYSTKHTADTIAAAHDGDVILAHVNQPNKPAGAGVVEGILNLKAKGFVFVKLDEPERDIGH
jgi:peptidoglycan/xylan/chitin deacetylase (PgdA/CDA1 family)